MLLSKILRTPAPALLRAPVPNGNRTSRVFSHFRTSNISHPLNAKKPAFSPEELERLSGDHTGRQQNHIWTAEEIKNVAKEHVQAQAGELE